MQGHTSVLNLASLQVGTHMHTPLQINIYIIICARTFAEDYC